MELGTINAANARDEFLTLLVTQLQHQDPLEPVKQQDFLSQLAQFSTLEGVENLNAGFEKQLSLQQNSLQIQQISQAASFIGAEVLYRDQNSGELTDGTISSVNVSAEGIQLAVGTKSIKLDQIEQINSLGSNETVAANSEATADSVEETVDRVRRIPPEFGAFVPGPPLFGQWTANRFQ